MTRSITTIPGLHQLAKTLARDSCATSASWQIVTRKVIYRIMQQQGYWSCLLLLASAAIQNSLMSIATAQWAVPIHTDVVPVIFFSFVDRCRMRTSEYWLRHRDTLLNGPQSVLEHDGWMIVGLKPLGTPLARSLLVGTCATLCYRHVTRDVPPQTSFKSVAFTKVSARKMIGLHKKWTLPYLMYFCCRQ